MNKYIRIFVSVSILIIAHAAAFSQTAAEMKTAGDAERAASAAYRAKSIPEFLKQIEIANANRPNHPRIIYNLAIAYALTGRNDDALTLLERLVKMGIAFAFQRNEDLNGLRDEERFKAIVNKTGDILKPVNAATRVLHLRDKTMIAESVALDPKATRFYIGSIHQRKIVAIDAIGAESEFSSPDDGLYAVLGMKVDHKRGILWAATSAIPQMRGYSEADKGRSGVFKYDLRTRKVISKFMLPVGEQHMLGDVWLDAKGNVFATDSDSLTIFRVDAAKKVIEPFISSDLFTSLQGITGGSNKNEIYVADYAKGIFRIDLASRAVVQIKPDAAVTVLGIDGLYSYQGRLIAIQNGITPNRVADFTIEGERITSTTILEANHPDFFEPTLGVIIGDDFYFVANSQWPLVNEKAELQSHKLREPVILKLRLK